MKMMKSPAENLITSPLKPTQKESIILPSRKTVEVLKCVLAFKKWEGVPVKDNYGGKTVIDHRHKPLFAELAILRMLEEDGWSGVWVDTYRKKFRDNLPELSQPVSLPPCRESTLKKIIKENGGLRGCWDVFAWKGDCIVFAESKRRLKDTIRNTQKRWLEIALQLGFPLESFLLAEWDLEKE